jgi:hypothetical protein
MRTIITRFFAFPSIFQFREIRASLFALLDLLLHKEIGRFFVEKPDYLDFCYIIDLELYTNYKHN